MLLAGVSLSEAVTCVVVLAVFVFGFYLLAQVVRPEEVPKSERPPRSTKFPGHGNQTEPASPEASPELQRAIASIPNSVLDDIDYVNHCPGPGVDVTVNTALPDVHWRAMNSRLRARHIAIYQDGIDPYLDEDGTDTYHWKPGTDASS
jgi:hypothetical protein